MSNSCVVYTDNLQHLALAMAHKWTLLLPVEVKSYTVPGRPSQYPRHFPTLSDPLRNEEIITRDLLFATVCRSGISGRASLTEVL
jgi:hypothetical protein